MSSAAVLTAEKSGARQIPKSNHLQSKKQELVNGSPPQGNANETVESLYQKVEDLALAEVLIPPTPLMISFSLLSFEDCDAAFEAMCQKWAAASPEQDTFLYLMTEAVVLSFANPTDMCGMFGNKHVNSQGYYKFKKIALKLKDQWQMTFRTHLNVCFGESKVPNAKKRVDSMNSLLKLLADLDCRTGNKVKAIDLTHLCKVAEKYLSEMLDRIVTMISELKSKKKLIPPPLKINKSATKQTENSFNTIKTTALSIGKETGSMPLSPINRNLNKNEINPRILTPKQPDGFDSGKKMVGNNKSIKKIQSKINFPKLAAQQNKIVSLMTSPKKRPLELTKKGACSCKNCISKTGLSLAQKNSGYPPAKQAKLEEVAVESDSSDLETASYSSDSPPSPLYDSSGSEPLSRFFYSSESDSFVSSDDAF